MSTDSEQTMAGPPSTAEQGETAPALTLALTSEMPQPPGSGPARLVAPSKRRTSGPGPADTERTHIRVTTPIGELFVVAGDSTIVGVYHQVHDPAPGEAMLGRLVEGTEQVGGGAAGAPPNAKYDAADTELLGRAGRELLQYLDGGRRVFDVPFVARGTEFQCNVWAIVEQVPYGQRCSYRDVATALGNPSMGRAIGAAIRANPLSIIVPGHRVVSSTGAVTGYAAGTEVKAALLDLEQRAVSEAAVSVVGPTTSDTADQV